MLNRTRTINPSLKYPLMWVMLLWAITLPGHEVIVYDFLLKVISGAPTTTLVNTKEAISRAEEQKNTCHVYLDAAPASFSGKFFSQPAHFVPPVFSLSFNLPEQLFSNPATGNWNRSLQKALLLSVLPNAP